MKPECPEITLVFTFGVWVCCSSPPGLPATAELQLQMSDKSCDWNLMVPKYVATKAETKERLNDGDS